jgi:hypothetical protein
MGVVALTWNSSGHETDGVEVAYDTVVPSSGALSSEYTTSPKERDAVKLTLFPSRWPVIVSTSPPGTGPLMVPLSEPTPRGAWWLHGWSSGVLGSGQVRAGHGRTL